MIVFIILLVVLYLLLLILLICRAWGKRNAALDYSRFVCRLYSESAQKVPVVIGRIQYSLVIDYNNYLIEHRILKLFFKPLPWEGPRPAGLSLYTSVRVR